MNQASSGYMEQVCYRDRSYVTGTGGAVSCNSPYAARAALRVLQQGGNAADAAIACSLTLGLVEPFNSGIGGGGFALYYRAADRSFHAFNGRGTAPAGAWRDMLLGKNGEPDPLLIESSGRSVALPALYRLLGRLNREQGTLSLAACSAEPIRLAREGFFSGALYGMAANCEIARDFEKRFRGFGALYRPEGRDIHYGERIRNPELADTMEQVSQKGIDWFYRGPAAEAIGRAAGEYRGILTAEDLASCRVPDLPVVRGAYRDCEVVSLAPPSSGGAHILEMLNILSHFDLKSMGALSADSIHVISETMKRMFADRSIAMADPAFNEVPLERLLSRELADAHAAAISLERAQEYLPDPSLAARAYRGCTTNFTIQDRFGNVICMTQTNRNWWGSGVAVPGYGFVLNNNMADFSAKTGVNTSQGLSYGQANGIEPGKTPLSSMSPVIVMKQGSPFLSVGAAGGPRIITAVLQTILNVVDFDMTMDRAVNCSHFCSLSLRQGLELEPGISPDTKRLLEAKGHRLIELSDEQVIKAYPNGILCREGQFYPGGTRRAEGGGGAITPDGQLVIDGICFEGL